MRSNDVQDFQNSVTPDDNFLTETAINMEQHLKGPT